MTVNETPGKTRAALPLWVAAAWLHSGSLVLTDASHFLLLVSSSSSALQHRVQAVSCSDWPSASRGKQWDADMKPRVVSHLFCRSILPLQQWPLQSCQLSPIERETHAFEWFLTLSLHTYDFSWRRIRTANGSYVYVYIYCTHPASYSTLMPRFWQLCYYYYCY